MRGEPIIIWGNGEVRRDFILIDDLIDAVELLLNKGISNEAVNIGCGIGHSLNEVLDLVRDMVPGLKVIYGESRLFDVQELVMTVLS
ncbi:MAG: NAD-dependent epimerase/dehydratase family protein [Fibrobacteria bacterium]|nr:NAD-dependent epimerase/dehydratase family protein [Fibrobacteria bacterium]